MPFILTWCFVSFPPWAYWRTLMVGQSFLTMIAIKTHKQSIWRPGGQSFLTIIAIKTYKQSIWRPGGRQGSSTQTCNAAQVPVSDRHDSCWQCNRMVLPLSRSQFCKRWLPPVIHLPVAFWYLFTGLDLPVGHADDALAEVAPHEGEEVTMGQVTMKLHLMKEGSQEWLKRADVR